MGKMNLFEAGDMQKHIEEKFGVHIHIHDQCGTDLWFHIEEDNPEVSDYIVKYLEERGHDVTVTQEGRQFTVK